MPFFNISLSGNQDIGVLNEVNIGMIKNMLINLSDFASHGNHGARIKIVVRGKGPGPEVVLLDGYDYTYDSLDVIKIPDPRGRVINSYHLLSPLPLFIKRVLKCI